MLKTILLEEEGEGRPLVSLILSAQSTSVANINTKKTLS